MPDPQYRQLSLPNQGQSRDTNYPRRDGAHRIIVDECVLYFNAPRGIHLWPPRDLLHDLRTARHSIWIVAPWFTDQEIAWAFLYSHAPEKALIVGLEEPGRRPSLALCQVAAYPEVGVYRVGTNDQLMHEKWIAIDDRVAWHGSSNPTVGARTNHEMLVRQVGGVEPFKREGEYLRSIGRRIVSDHPP